MNFTKLFLLTTVSLLVNWSTAHHIVFENIGEMATAVTYIHAKFTINITSIEEHFATYFSAISNMKAKVAKFTGKIKDLHGVGYDHKTDSVMLKTVNLLRVIKEQNLNQIFQWRQDSGTKLMIKLHAIKNSLSKPIMRKDHIILKRNVYSNATSTQLKEKFEDAVKNKVSDMITAGVRSTRFVGGLSLGLGALGTFMGLYNKKQIDQLKRSFSELNDNHNKLIEVIQDQGGQIMDLQKNEQVILRHMADSYICDPAFITHELLSMEMEIAQRVETAVHGIQMAQLRRLATDLIPAGQLIALYNRIILQSQQIGHKLLTNAPSDLFQLEISYLFDGDNVHLILHVPSVPESSLLRLLKLHPFPLPITSNFSVIPSVKDDILAISSGMFRYSAQISSVDLLGCHTINNIYLCEKSGVLSKKLNGTCMGALYVQDFTAAQELCDLELQPSRELVKPLLRNEFLIFSPEPQTSFVTCQNGTQSEIYVPIGISKIHISAGCKANLNDHILVTDNAVRLDTDIIHYEWNFDSRTKLPFNDEDLPERLEELLLSGITTPTMNDLQHLKLKRSKMNYFWYFASFILSICGCTLITILIMILWCRYPLAKLPCFGPFLAALNIVSKIRVTSYKVTKPKPRPRRREPEPEPEPIELEELHPVVRQVQ